MEKFRLIKTCESCPEQYDVFYKKRKVGYLRLRHGYFRAECLPDGEVVYSAEPRGSGQFKEDERRKHLTRACRAIWEAMHHGGGDEEWYTIE